MPVSGPILVFLANGTQGSAVMRAARQRGHVVRPLIRTRSNDSPADAVDADLDDPASLIAAARGCAHAVLQVPTAAEAVMVRRTESALGALCHAGVRSIVLKLASASRSAPCEEPSFVANAAIEALVRRAGIPFAIVRPTMYLDNMLKPSARADIIERGVFSPPIARDQRIAWTSVDDCALGAVRLLEQDCYGGDHLICGPESVTGDELAAPLGRIWKAHILSCRAAGDFRAGLRCSDGVRPRPTHRFQVPLLARASRGRRSNSWSVSETSPAAGLPSQHDRSLGARTTSPFLVRRGRDRVCESDGTSHSVNMAKQVIWNRHL